MGKLCGKIVLTGGPCGGKTSAITRIEDELTSLGYHVIIIQESATELIKGGIRAFGNNKIDILDFQRLILKYQIDKEDFYENTVNLFPNDTNCFIICDRGALDNEAYITKEKFNQIIKEYGHTRISLLDRYDLVLHLVTAADGKEEFYTLENNQARTETIEEAKILDRKTMNAWIGHNHLKIFDNKENFECKLENIRTTIQEFLGNPISIRRERKYLIDPNNSDLSFLITTPHTKTRIEQYYIEQENYKEYEKRLRKKIYEDTESYYYTIQKRTNNGNKEIKIDKKITKEEFYNLLYNHNIISEIKKTRISFIHNKQYFRLDIFEDNPNVILEIEATKENQNIDAPPFLDIIKDITNEKEYQNINLSYKYKSKIKQKSKK